MFDDERVMNNLCVLEIVPQLPLREVSNGARDKEASPRQWEHLSPSCCHFIGRPPVWRIRVRQAHKRPAFCDTQFGKFDRRKSESIGYYDEAWSNAPERSLNIQNYF